MKLKNLKKETKLFICSNIRINLKVRGTSKNGSIRANKSKINELRKKLIKERNEKIQITEFTFIDRLKNTDHIILVEELIA